MSFDKDIVLKWGTTNHLPSVLMLATPEKHLFLEEKSGRKKMTVKESALSCKRAISECVYVPEELRKLGKGVVD